jgi:hypothetical protein
MNRTELENLPDDLALALARSVRLMLSDAQRARHPDWFNDDIDPQE